MNKYLKKAKSHLKHYFCYFKHENILVISEDKSVLPFAVLVSDETNYPGKLLLSLAIDYPISEKAVDVALLANKSLPVMVSDHFYISKSGTTHVGEDAGKYYELDSILPIEEIIPENNNVH